MSHRAYLLLGSNIDPAHNLPAACRLLAEYGGIARVSQVWESPPADGSDQANYLNAAVLLETRLSAQALRRDVLPAIESTLVRIRDPHDRYAARTIDIDLVLYDRDVIDEPGLTIPDADIERRPFVATPLAEIDPEYVHPVVGRTLRAIADRLGRNALTRRADVLLSPAPVK